jgi:ankyrin repeat protein
MTIVDHETQHTYTAELNFEGGRHCYLSVAKRENGERHSLKLEDYRNAYSAERQSLFLLSNPSVSNLSYNDILSPYSYYAFDIKHNYQKLQVVEHMLLNSKKNPKLIEHALHLVSTLPATDAAFSRFRTAIIQSEAWKYNEECKQYLPATPHKALLKAIHMDATDLFLMLLNEIDIVAITNDADKMKIAKYMLSKGKEYSQLISAAYPIITNMGDSSEWDNQIFETIIEFKCWKYEDYYRHLLKNPKLALLTMCYLNAEEALSDLLPSIRHMISEDIAHRAAIIASNKRNISTIQLLLASFPCIDIDKVDELEHTTLLHMAVYSHQPEMVELILSYGSNSNSRDMHSLSPLHAAVNNQDNGRIFELLLRYGADINVLDKEGNTPLHLAVYQCTCEAMKFLMAHKANGRVANDDGMTPLHLAVKFNDVAKVKMLLHSSVEVNAQDKQGKTPLDYAIDYRETQTNTININNARIITLLEHYSATHTIIDEDQEIPSYLQDTLAMIAQEYHS